jgi:C2H2-type zinc-finger domain
VANNESRLPRYCDARDCFQLSHSSNRFLPRSHSRKHQELDVKFSCEHCDYRTKISSHFRRHMRVHEKDDGKIYKCPHCDYACNNSVSVGAFGSAYLLT